jgi:hypothetical protein
MEDAVPARVDGIVLHHEVPPWAASGRETEQDRGTVP